ncbi:uncharacterized protein [Clytia hemisphaerica]|uniref:Uncharacterized protein n=1 Tax=Clytia hemisphaerica TaxID=252671 RepID=A0A7M5V6D0_9CNID
MRNLSLCVFFLLAVTMVASRPIEDSSAQGDVIMSDDALQVVYNDILNTANQVNSATSELKRAVGNRYSSCNPDVEDCGSEKNKPHISQINADADKREGYGNGFSPWLHRYKDTASERVPIYHFDSRAAKRVPMYHFKDGASPEKRAHKVPMYHFKDVASPEKRAHKVPMYHFKDAVSSRKRSRNVPMYHFKDVASPEKRARVVPMYHFKDVASPEKRARVVPMYHFKDVASPEKRARVVPMYHFKDTKAEKFSFYH